MKVVWYTDRNLMVESTIFDGKPEPLGILSVSPKNMLLNINTFREMSPRMMVKIRNSYANFFWDKIYL